jgi:mannosyl-3-phosphoglycerate synthase
MTLDLGLKLRLAGGFAVEPYEYVDLFEQFGGVLESNDPDVMTSSVPVVQIETRNPHFHDNKGEEHVQGMRMQALNVVYHSPVTLPAVRQAIIEFMVSQGALEVGLEPPRERVYPPVGSLDLDLLYDGLDAEALSFRQLDGRAASGLSPAPPIDRNTIPRASI